MQIRSLLFLSVLATVAFAAAPNPVPLVNIPLVPDSAAPGSAAFTLTVNGTGFAAGSVVNWNGNPRATVFVNQSQLTAGILAGDVAAARTASVTVTNPAPGGGTSDVAFFQVATAAAAVGMAVPASLPPSLPTGAIATADLNGDGKLDLVIGNYPGNAGDGVNVMLGNGDGTFQSPTLLATPNLYAYALVIGDFNGDSRPDLGIVTNGGVQIAPGNGDGTFQPAKTCGSGAASNSAVVGDFNGDGNLDVVVGYSGIQVLLGNGDGTCQVGASYLAGNGVRAMVTGDFDHDGKLDLAVADSGGINILLGNGDGTFQNPVLIAPGNAAGLTTADFNGDGILDLAFTIYAANGNQISILWGKGKAAFRDGGSYFAGENTTTVVAADFNGDGKVDLAVPTGQASVGAISILLGNGDGTFQAAQKSAGQPALWNDFAIGDFNGDGMLDLASALSVDLQTLASMSPGIISFAPTLENTTTAPKTVTLTNLSTAPLNVTQVALSGTNASEFAITSDTCQGASLPAAATCTVGVMFAPTAVANQYAFLTITDSASVSPQTTALTGNGTAIDLTPARLDFGSVKVGSISKQQIIRAKNIGSTTVDIQGIYMVGHTSKDFLMSNTCGKKLGPKTTCSIVVQFIPAKKGAAKAAVSFKIHDGTVADPKTIAVSGTGT